MRLLICTQAVDENDPVLGFFLGWIKEFAKHCDRVTILCLREGKHELPENVTVKPLASTHRITRTIEVISQSWKLRHEYDAVFVHMNPEYADVAGWLWALLGKHVVLWYTHKATPWTLHFAMPFVDTVATASKESFRLPSKKVVVTGHGIDISRPVPERRMSQDGSIRLITTGRVTSTKHIDIIIGAYLELLKRGTRAGLKVYGKPASEVDYEYEDRLRTVLSAAGQDPESVFVGAVPHAKLPELRADADYFLHASETGSLDKAVLDAALSGVIPISSSEAYVEFFEGYEALLRYPKGDTTALADRVLALQSLSEEQRNEIRDALKERVMINHSLPALIGRLDILLRGI